MESDRKFRNSNNTESSRDAAPTSMCQRNSHVHRKGGPKGKEIQVVGVTGVRQRNVAYSHRDVRLSVSAVAVFRELTKWSAVWLGTGRPAAGLEPPGPHSIQSRHRAVTEPSPPPPGHGSRRPSPPAAAVGERSPRDDGNDTQPASDRRSPGRRRLVKL